MTEVGLNFNYIAFSNLREIITHHHFRPCVVVGRRVEEDLPERLEGLRDGEHEGVELVLVLALRGTQFKCSIECSTGFAFVNLNIVSSRSINRAVEFRISSQVDHEEAPQRRVEYGPAAHLRHRHGHTQERVVLCM